MVGKEYFLLLQGKFFQEHVLLIFIDNRNSCRKMRFIDHLLNYDSGKNYFLNQSIRNSFEVIQPNSS